MKGAVVRVGAAQPRLRILVRALRCAEQGGERSAVEPQRLNEVEPAVDDRENLPKEDARRGLARELEEADAVPVDDLGKARQLRVAPLLAAIEAWCRHPPVVSWRQRLRLFPTLR